jgi:isopentenyldiphosphate isomerase
MDELIDILDSKGNYTGKTCLKSEAHAKGLFHPTIHVWCYSINGEILLQQRSKLKKIFPLKWDVSVAGHIGAGESAELGAIRETEEEIGVQIIAKNLEKIGVFKTEIKHSETLLDCEFKHTFLYALDKGVKLTKQTSEVEDLQWLTIEDFDSWINTKHPDIIPNSEKRFQFIISEIQKRLKV